jgi:predicted MPP superfamily phosphohydrolase
MASRLEMLLFHGGWPARLSRLVGYEPLLRVIYHDVELPGAWQAPRQLKVAFASDFHAGPTTNPGLLDRACKALCLANPDVLLLGGDFASAELREIDWLAARLGETPAPMGRFAVLGNHDHANGPGYITRALEAAGIEVLTNGNRRLPSPFDGVWVCGLDDFLCGAPDAERALAGAEGMRIVLMHAPAGLLDLGGARFELALCGHTHGGQVALPNGRPLTVAPGPLSRAYSRGRFPLLHGGTLIVTVGLGCSGFPLRLNATAEVLVVSIGPERGSWTGTSRGESGA